MRVLRPHYPLSSLARLHDCTFLSRKSFVSFWTPAWRTENADFVCWVWLWLTSVGTRTLQPAVCCAVQALSCACAARLWCFPSACAGCICLLQALPSSGSLQQHWHMQQVVALRPLTLTWGGGWGRSFCSGVAPGHGVSSALHAAEPAVYVPCCHLSLSASLFWCCASWDAAALSSFCLLSWYAALPALWRRQERLLLLAFAALFCKAVLAGIAAHHPLIGRPSYHASLGHCASVYAACILSPALPSRHLTRLPCVVVVLLSWHTAADLVLSACTYTVFCMMITQGGGGGQGVWGFSPID